MTNSTNKGLKGLMTNIPPAAKMSLVACTGIALLSLIVAANWLRSGEQSNVNEVSANANIVLGDSLGAKSDNPVAIDGTALDTEIETLKVQEVDEARKKSSSFIEDLEVVNALKKIGDINRNIHDNKVDNGLEFSSAESRSAITRKNAKLKEEQLTLERHLESISVTRDKDIEAARQQGAQAVLRAQLSDDYINEELARARDGIGRMADQMRMITAPEAGGVAVIKVSRDKPVANDGNNVASDGNNDLFAGSVKDLASSKARLVQSQKHRMSQIGALTGGQGNGAFEPASVSPSDNTGDDATGPYIPTGSMFYAALEIGVNSDELSPVRAIVIEPGVLYGAVLVGEPKRVGEKVMLSFSNMSLHGKDYGISVVALDPDTMRTGLADDVNRHTLSRYFKLATAAALQGYAEALSNTTTTTQSDGSVVQSSGSLPDSGDQTRFAAGTVGEKLVPIFEKEFDRPPTVRVDGKGRDLGIMLMSGLQL